MCDAIGLQTMYYQSFHPTKNYLNEKPDTKVSELTKHLAKQDHWPELDPKEKPTHQMICCKLEFSTLYQANLVSVVRTFGTSKCRICAREKLDIFKHSFNPLVKLMNNCLEIYGACKHKPKFHRYSSTDESTDKKS